MKRQLFFIAAVLFFLCDTAQAQDGLSCETAIPVDTSYVGSVPAAGTFYYSASTYDLPMTCYFYPEHPIENAPKIYVDFTCTPGVYDDPNIVKLLDAGSGWGIALPLILTFTDEYDQDYNKYYSLTISESYRELMAQYNITYNVDAIVKVEAPCAGQIRMAPDTTFKSCVENSVWLNLPDTIVTGLQHDADSYVLPFADWKNDSIQFRWTGNTPVTVWIGETCDFEFKTSGPDCALDMFVLYPDAGNGENIRVFTKQEIADYISIFGVGGVYYLRTVCSEDGELIVEKKPINEAMAKAKALAINEGASVAANDTAQVYYFPTTWKENSMIWTSSSEHTVTAYFSTNIHFTADKNDPNIIDTYSFAYAYNGRELALSQKQLKDICSQAIGDFVFVKFVTEHSSTITPALWSAGPCAENADELFVNDSVRLQRNATTTAWRVNINQWSQQDVKLYWKGTSSNKVFLCDTCKGFTLNKTNAHVKLYKEISVNSDGTRDTLLLTKDELAAVAQYADADGFLYFRFNNSATGSLITVAEVSVPQPPTPPVNPCLAVLPLSVPANKELTPALADSVYAIAVDELTKDSIRFTWKGVEAPLVIYMGNSCDVPADPNPTVTLQAGDSADFATADLKYIAADGKLYLRFVTTTTAQLVVDYILPKQDDIETLCLPLKLDSTIKVLAANLEHVYYFGTDWANHSVEFVANSTDSIVAYMGLTPDFSLDPADSNYLGAYAFAQENGTNSLQLSALQITQLLEQGNPIYVIFYADYATEVTPIIWNACACVENSLELYPVDTKRIAAHSSSTVYRVKYSQWQDREVRLHWSGAETLWAYLADTCDFYLAANNEHVLNYNDVDILPNDTMVIGADVQMEAIDFGALPGHGFLYFRFHAPQAGVLTTTIIKDEQQGPITGVEDTDVEDASRRIVCTPDGHIYILVGKDRYTILGEKL
jgi:hypothetical protein